MIYVLGMCAFTETGMHTQTAHGLSKEAAIKLFEAAKEEAIETGAEVIIHLHEIENEEEDDPAITIIKRFLQRPEVK